ncbi:O-antigen translocase [Aureimonas sp. AU20]|uniref:O-antigen translocase n=1 Tax=Aureimonas sp. AU20 TaxID=1349819 RepID=UPI00072076FD|nr:O-antigen translocase [Aureimonas sp. AU20]ALN74679.1 hypothetical protein M673_18330 [Aureimonas sp. AU20]
MNPQAPPIDRRTYGQILKSTVLIGGSSLVNILLGMLRAKLFALLLGPGGVGLMGLYMAVVDLAQTLAGLGVQSSGVRQIAEAAGSGDRARIARTALVLKRLSLGLAVGGAGLLALFSGPVAQITFGDQTHAGAIACLSLAVFFRLVSGAQAAVIQGLRRISDLARIGVLGTLLGTLATIPLIYGLGERGIVPSIIAMAAASALVSWWYSRRIDLGACEPSALPVRGEVASLLKLGFAFMASGFLTIGAAYLVRILVVQHEGVAQAGLYQAAWTLGGLYAGFILQAMGADFYPRLTAAAQNKDECNRLVNEQAEISILMAGPGVLATLTFAPLIMTVFYSAEFGPAAGLLRWVCLGMTLRIVAWPVGFIFLARNAQAVFFCTELAAAVVHVALAWLLISRIGLDGAGQAFFGLYVWHTAAVYLLAHRMTGFRLSATNRRLGLLLILSMALVFAAFERLPLWPATFVGTAAVLASSLVSFHVLMRIVSPDALPPMLRDRLPRRLSNAHRRIHSGRIG